MRWRPAAIWLALAGVAALVAGCARHATGTALAETPVAVAERAAESVAPPRSPTAGATEAQPAPPATPRVSGKIPLRYAGVTVKAGSRPSGFPDKLAALTFDDGPDVEATPKVLRALAAKGARATFFVRGDKAKAHPELLRAIADGDNIVGNHTWSHVDRPSADEAEREIRDTGNAIKEALNRQPALFRPPSGRLDTPLPDKAKALGYTVVLWQVHGADAGNDKKPATETAAGVVGSVRPGDIVLLHDSHWNHTAEAVPIILDKLGQRGFRFVTVAEMFQAWDAWLSKTESQPSPSPTKGPAR